MWHLHMFAMPPIYSNSDKIRLAIACQIQDASHDKATLSIRVCGNAASMAAMPQPESGETGAVWNFMRFLCMFFWVFFS